MSSEAYDNAVDKATIALLLESETLGPEVIREEIQNIQKNPHADWATVIIRKATQRAISIARSVLQAPSIREKLMSLKEDRDDGTILRLKQHITALKSWKANRANMNLDVTPLDASIKYLEDYRTLLKARVLESVEAEEKLQKLSPPFQKISAHDPLADPNSLSQIFDKYRKNSDGLARKIF